MTSVIFTRAYHEYREGACAQFSDATAQLLAEQGYVILESEAETVADAPVTDAPTADAPESDAPVTKPTPKKKK